MNERRSLQLLAEQYEQVLEKGKGTRAGPRYRVSDDIRNQILSTFQQGIANNNPEDTDVVKLAQRFNVHHNTVSNFIRQSGVSGRSRGVPQRGNIVQRDSQKIFPAQIEYINKLISQRDAEGVFEHGISSILKMINDHINAHPELNWHKPARMSINNYIKKWEEKNILGKTRMDFGVKKSNGIIVSRGTGQRIRAPRALDPNDNSYQTAVGRAQKINDQDFLPPGS